MLLALKPQYPEDLPLRDARVPVHVHLLEGLHEQALVVVVELQDDRGDELMLCYFSHSITSMTPLEELCLIIGIIPCS